MTSISKQLTLSFVGDSAMIGGQSIGLLYRGVSPANLTVMQERDSEKMMIGISGLKCLESLESFNPTGLWAKTFAALLVGMGGWYSTRCNLIWKFRVTKSCRFYFQLAASTHRINEIGSGLLPTPIVTDTTGPGTCLAKIDQRRTKALLSKKNGNGFGMSLGEMCQRGLLPTPIARDYRSPHAENSGAFTKRKNHPRGVNLTEHLQRMNDGQNSLLNPRFVLEMMGYPPDWTELPFKNGV